METQGYSRATLSLSPIEFSRLQLNHVDTTVRVLRSRRKGFPASSVIDEHMSAILDCSGEERLMRWAHLYLLNSCSESIQVQVWYSYPVFVSVTLGPSQKELQWKSDLKRTSVALLLTVDGEGKWSRLAQQAPNAGQNRVGTTLCFPLNCPLAPLQMKSV